MNKYYITKNGDQWRLAKEGAKKAIKVICCHSPECLGNIRGLLCVHFPGHGVGSS